MRRILIIILLLHLLGCSVDSSEKGVRDNEFRVEKSPVIEKVTPEKPVKIKVKRDVQGRYSWELSGDNVEEILKIDRRLKKALDTPKQE